MRTSESLFVDKYLTGHGPNTAGQRLALYAAGQARQMDESGLGTVFGDPSGAEPITDANGRIRLKGYTITPTVRPGGAILLTLLWEGLRPVNPSYHVFVHLLDERGAIVAQKDGQPVQWTRPTNSLQPGEQIADRYGILLSENFVPGRYQLAVGLYEPVTGQRLPVSAGPSSYALDLGPSRFVSGEAPGRRSVPSGKRVRDAEATHPVLAARFLDFNWGTRSHGYEMDARNCCVRRTLFGADASRMRPGCRANAGAHRHACGCSRLGAGRDHHPTGARECTHSHQQRRRVAVEIPTVQMQPATPAMLSTPTVSIPEVIEANGACSVEYDLDLASYPDLTGQMGCALSEAKYDPVGINEFSAGPGNNRFMLWFGSEGQIYVLFPDQPGRPPRTRGKRDSLSFRATP